MPWKAMLIQLRGDRDLKNVVIYRGDSEEMDRVFGDSTSVARKVRSMLEVIKRERLVEKVRRGVLGGLDAVYLVSSEEEDAPKVPPIGGGGV